MSQAVEMRRITAAIIVSALGTWSYNVAIAVYAYERTGSTAWVAAATVGRYVPALVIASVGSRLTSGLPRRTVAVVCDVVCTLSMVLLTFIAATEGSLVLAIALAAVSSGAARVQAAAALALAADITVETELVRRMAFISTADAVATAVGPALASLVLLVADADWLFLLNAVSFAASAVLLVGVRNLRRRPTSVAASAEVAAAPRSARRTVVATVWPLMAVRTLAAFVYGADVVLLAVVATENLRSGTSGYGWLLAFAGIGGLLGALLLRRRPDGSVTRRTAAGMALYVVPLVGLALALGLGGSLAVQLVRGAGLVLVVTVVVTALQRSVPSELSQDVLGQTHSLVLVGTVLGSVAAPVLIDRVGLSAAILVIAGVTVLVLLALLPSVRRYERLAEFSAEALDPVVSTLRGLTLFQDASRWTLIEVADRAEPRGFEDGRPIVVEGETADALYVLVDGEVDVWSDVDGRREHLRRMTAPSYFGEIGLVHGVARTATVTAAGRVTVWRVPADAFLGAAASAGLSSALSDGVRVRLGTAPGRSVPLDA